jgi:predicted PolB exonuclease-like 3'-5' exonuclease
MDIYIDIETLRSPEAHRLQILKDVKENFKAPSTLTKAQAAIDLGLTDAKEIKFTSKDDMIARWEKELAKTKSEDVAQAQWEKTSFDPNVAQIACICTYAKGYQQQFDLIDFKSEKAMLSEFHEYINALCSANDVESIRKPNFIGHYITKFDLPFIWKRSVINDVETCRNVKWVDVKHGYGCYDTMTAWAGYGNSISADNLCAILGIKGKTEGMDGSLVYNTWQTNPQKVIDYCHDDVAMVKAIHERLIK